MIHWFESLLTYQCEAYSSGKKFTTNTEFFLATLTESLGVAEQKSSENLAFSAAKFKYSTQT